MTFSSDDFRYMALAIQEAQKGLFTTDPNPRVGAVLVNAGQIVGSGWHVRAGEPHAEVHALQQASTRAEGGTCYVTLEPCSHVGKTPPCADALIAAGVGRVVVAMQDPNPLVAGRGIEKLRAAGIKVEVGCLTEQARTLNPGFIKRMELGLPLLRIKMGSSLDGRIALANGASQWITGPDAREDVQRLRARSSLVLTGSGTLLADDPSLNVRSSKVLAEMGAAVRQPSRAVLDSRGVARPAMKLFANKGSTYIFSSRQGAQALEKESFPDRVSVLTVPVTAEGLDLESVLRQLASMQCNEILVEAGPRLAGRFLQQGLVDEFWLYQGAQCLGDQARALVDMTEITRLNEAPTLQRIDVRMVGQDLRQIFRVA